LKWLQRLAGRIAPGWQATPVGLASFALVVLGLLLGATVNMAWLLLLGAGCFGPGLLRELRLLRDCDEFQRQSSIRAGYHAFLAGGLFLVIVVAVRAWGHRSLGNHDAFPASLVLTCMLVTYALSQLTRFWGARAAAFRILLMFGFFWFCFVALSHAGEPINLLVELLLPLILVALAFASRRWPRPVGAVLLATGIGALFLFHIEEGFTGNSGRLYVFFLLLLPLLYTGAGLLGMPAGSAAEG